MVTDDPNGRSARLDAPTNRQYRLMKIDTNRHVDPEYRKECMFVLVTMGELGLRAGEVAHMRREWVDESNKSIQIPRFDECDHGESGGVCGYCTAQAKLSVENNGIPLEEALENRWEPKIEASARTVPYHWSDEIVRIYDRFFIDRDRFDLSRVAVNRRVNRIARATDVIDEDDIYPHALRAHAAIHHVNNGLRAFPLAKFMGWDGPSGALPYIKLASKDVKSAFDQAYKNDPFT